MAAAVALGAKLETAGEGAAELEIGWALGMGIGSALHAAQMLELAAGGLSGEINPTIARPGAAEASKLLAAARALYEQMLALTGLGRGVVPTGTGVRSATSSDTGLVEAKVRRRLWLHAKQTGDAAMRVEQQLAMVGSLASAGRWEGSCAICLEDLQAAAPDLDVVECLHCFHVKCTRELTSRNADVRELAGAPRGTVSNCQLEMTVECPLCRRSLCLLAKKPSA